MPPVVGISSPSAHRHSPVLGVERALTTLDRAYIEAVATAGGATMVLAVQDPAVAPALVDRLDALVLSGGGDVAPERYGATRHPAVAGVDEGRDAWEVGLIEAARARRLPILAICRGLQILNVTLGGTLVQHLPDHEAAGGDPHLVPSRYDAAAHHVEVVAGTRLAKVLDHERVDVNTLHHQAIDRVAEELVVSGRDQHGTVEAAELPDEPVLGVQWHPELIARAAPHDRLFAWVVEEAAARRGR